MNAKINIGLRHILLVYPLLYILLGQLRTPALWTSTKGRVFSLCLFAALAFESLSVGPHYLAFFNRPSGGPESGIRYLSDSNIDWGQDLKNLSIFLRNEGNPEILLSYFGSAVPQKYGIKAQELPTVWSFPKSERVNSDNPAKEYLAVSVTNLQGTYFGKHDLYGWLINKKPVRKIGYSIHVYDVTNDLESLQKIMEIYAITGERDKYLRQERRIKLLARPKKT